MVGTVYEQIDGRLTRVVDRTGATWAELAWSGDRLVRLTVPGATVEGAIVRDPLLGDAHVVAATVISTIDWARPTEIPAIAAPGRLPAGSGGAIINVIAILAQRAGVAALRYAGPYPTHALWRTLARSFRTTGSEAAFTASALDRMLRLVRDPIAIDFIPAPHERLAIANGHVELRDGAIDRVMLDGIAYEPDGSPARVCDHRAELWFGDRMYAHVATFAADGSLVDGPHAIPACTSDVIDQPFPPALVAAIAELVAESVPAPLAADARAWLVARSIRWADLAARLACETRDGLAVHAAIWQHVGPLGLGRLALALAEAIAPVASAAVLREVATERATVGSPEDQ